MASRRVGETGVLRTMFGLIVLTAFAAVIIIPFIYMVLISLETSSEFGSGRFLPEGVSDLVALGSKQATWIRTDLSDEEAAALNSVKHVPIVLRSAGDVSLDNQKVPGAAVYARKLSLERMETERLPVTSLLEIKGKALLNPGTSVTVYVPAKVEGLWIAVPARIVSRNVVSVLDRLVTNYRGLLRLDTLTKGQLVEWVSSGYPRWYFNSLIVAFVTVVLGLFFDSLAAFAFAKYEFPFRGFLFGVVIATVMIPYPVTLVPSFFIFAKLGLYNTYAALVIPGLVSAFGIFLVRQYLLGVPDDMLSAARVDGASDFSVYRFIVLPIARPVLAALAVFRFIWQWNSYLFPLVLTNSDSMKTVQLGIATMQNSYGRVEYGVQMAGATLAVVPILVVYACMQKHFIAGITLGSVKD